MADASGHQGIRVKTNGKTGSVESPERRQPPKWKAMVPSRT